MKITYINKVDDYTLTGSEDNTIYPASNVQNTHLSTYWIVGNTSAWLKIDAGEAISIGACFVAGTNITDTGSIKIQANNTDVWTSPSVDITLEKVNDIYYTWNSLGEYRYWRLVIEDASVEDIKVGRWFMGDVLELYGPSNVFEEKYIDTSEYFISQSGQVYGNEKYSYYEYEMTYPVWSNDERQAAKDFNDYCKKSRSFFTSFSDKEDYTLGPFYMIQTKDLGFGNLRNLDLWSCTMNFRQVF